MTESKDKKPEMLIKPKHLTSQKQKEFATLIWRAIVGSFDNKKASKRIAEAIFSTLKTADESGIDFSGDDIFCDLFAKFNQEFN